MDDETQFCLKWHNHQSTLIRNFDTLLESGTLVDCTLAAEGRYLKAHKVVLSACSPYFEGLLSEHYDKHPVFILKDVKFVELKAMMDYMYRGEVNISQNQLTALLKAAESLQIKGLSDSKTTGSSNNSTVAGRVEPKSTATSASNAVTTAVDIPQGSSGLTIEKNNKVPRQRLTQTSANMSEGGASPQQVRGISSREGSVSPTRKRRARRRSLGNDESNSMENHEASNSSDVTASATVMAAPTVEDKSHAESADPIGRSALMQQLTKSNDDMLQMQMEKPEPTEDMIQPKSEYMEDQESVEDLTHLDDDMNDLNEMEQDNSRAGPSHDSSHPGLASWHITSDRSNAGVGAAGGAPGAEDAVFMNAHEPNAAQRDSQGQNKARNQAEKLFSCTQCYKKSYLSEPCLKRHMKLECQKPPGFKCIICEKCFHQKCNLKRHMNTHAKEGNDELADQISSGTLGCNQYSCNDEEVSEPQKKITPRKKSTRRSSTEDSPPKKSSPNKISTEKTPRKKSSPRRYSKEKTPPQKTFAGKTSPKTISSEKIYSQVNSELVSQSVTGMIPSGVIPPGMIQVGMIPPRMIPTGMIPPGMFPAGMIPPGMNSSGMIPPGMNSSGVSLR